MMPDTNAVAKWMQFFDCEDVAVPLCYNVTVSIYTLTCCWFFMGVNAEMNGSMAHAFVCLILD